MRYKVLKALLEQELDECYGENPNIYFYIDNYGVYAELIKVDGFSDSEITIRLKAEEI